MQTQDSIPTPEGFKRVTEDEFWAYIREVPFNIHPSTRFPDHTPWEDNNRQIKAISFPGWKNPGDPKAFFIPKGGDS